MSRLREVAELVKISHTVFALPFALLGLVLGAGGWPPVATLAGVVTAVAALRVAAMANNRLVDRRIDAANPRTADRALPAGRLAAAEVLVLVLAGAGLFLGAAALLGPAPAALSPLALALALGYSWTKRFTASSHFVLGATLGLAPLGGWLAARGTAAGYPALLSVGVLLWVAGFDVVYACADERCDRAAGLHSLPAALGARRALAVARALHLAAFAAFACAGIEADLGTPWAIGLGVAGTALLVEHRLVRPGEYDRLPFAFLVLNGAVSLVLLVTGCVAVLGAA